MNKSISIIEKFMWKYDNCFLGYHGNHKWDVWSHFSTLEIWLFMGFKKMYTFLYVALFDFKLW